MFIQSNGTRIYFPPRGPSGPDGNPIGTVISYMGKAAPKDYLICDGSVYYISAYPELSTFFEEQFGTKNYFGGDGTSTFAVPDMRNLFLRGYKGESTEQLSGEVGVKQEATEHIYAGGKERLWLEATEGRTVKNADSVSLVSTGTAYSQLVYEDSADTPSHYKAHPVNMAVLYCIKYCTSVPEEDIYSTEERIVGRWIDGKPVYKKTWTFTTPSVYRVWENIGVSVDDIDNLVESKNSFISRDGGVVTFNYYDTSAIAVFSYRADGAKVYLAHPGGDYFKSCPGYATLWYTKTTDLAPNADPTATPQSTEVETLSYDFYQDYDEEVA